MEALIKLHQFLVEHNNGNNYMELRYRNLVMVSSVSLRTVPYKSETKRDQFSEEKNFGARLTRALNCFIPTSKNCCSQAALRYPSLKTGSKTIQHVNRKPTKIMMHTMSDKVYIGIISTAVIFLQ
jgi:hypothetical protein